MYAGGALLELGLDALQPLDALLHRRVRREQRRDRVLRRAAGMMKKAFISLGGAQVLLRDAAPSGRRSSCSAEASALGRPVMIAAPRSAVNSR